MHVRHLFALLLAVAAVFYLANHNSARASSVNVTATASTSCGDSVIQAPEQCDGANLDGATCDSLGYSGGTLSCASNCVFNTSQCTAPSGGGGGGGGVPGDVDDLQPSIIFSGRAYPFATIVISEGSAIKKSAIADGAANFQATLATIAGNHTFTVYAVDKHGRRSPQSTFSTKVQEDAVNAITNIFIPPTIELSRSPVRRGDTLNVLGLTVPQGVVAAYIDSAAQSSVSGAARGDGSYTLSTGIGLLTLGPHTVRVRVTAPDGVISGPSETLNFNIGELSGCQKEIGDLNCDGRVGVRDMSILLYWWQTDAPQGLEVADLNRDDKVGLMDLSVMLYYWT